MLAAVVEYLMAAFLAASVGAAELTTRYRDAPAEVLKLWATWTYIGLNAAAGVAALFVINAFGWTFGASGDATSVARVAAAGIGAMAVFRSTLFSVRVGDVDVDAGPHALLKAILGTLDRAVDRKRAQHRSRVVGEAMKNVDFEKAKQALPADALALMQNVSPEEQRAVGNEVSKLVDAEGLSATVKSRNLGLLLLNVTGEDVLNASVDALSKEIKRDEKGTSTRDDLTPSA